MPFNLDRVTSRLPGREIHYFESIDTTMHEAARLANLGAPSGTTVVAGEQTAGQGRHGHSWFSQPEAGLYASILLRPDLSKESAPTLTIALGLAVLDAISEAARLPCDLRWPNDVMIGEKKAAGILAQLIDSAAIAGIGINVNHEKFPAELAQEATSLRLESGREQSRERILAALLPAVDRYVDLLVESGSGPILDQFSRRSSYSSGKRVEVHQGDSLIRGTTAGLNDAGFLVIRKDDGSDEVILAGGVRAVGSRRR